MGVADNLKRGTVELLLLTLLQEEDMYGYQLVQLLAERTGGRFTLQEGSLYPILYRLAEKGYIMDRQELVGKRRTRVYYHLEPAGRDYLAQLRREYFQIHQGITMLLNNSAGGVESDAPAFT